MTFQDYQKKALKTLSTKFNFGEVKESKVSGELYSNINSISNCSSNIHRIYHYSAQKRVESDSVERELMYYEVGRAIYNSILAANELGYSYLDVLEWNINKLSKRYSKGEFSENEALNRDTTNELSHIPSKKE
jgi:hypothetical protein